MGQFCLYLALFNTFGCYIFWDKVYCIVSNFRHFRIGCPTWKSSHPWWQPLSTISNSFLLRFFNTFLMKMVQYIFWNTVYCIVSNFRHFRIGCPTWKSSRPWWQPLSTISTIREPPTTFTSIQARVWLLSITTELSWKTIMFRHFSGRIYNLFLLKKPSLFSFGL